MISAPEALVRLREGNARFVSGLPSDNSRTHQTRRAETEQGQEPFAIVLGCSDSRVPAEIVFDQGLGDLFVIRVAGNIVAPSIVGSIEFAASQFRTRLVVVLGHSRCGAICTALKNLQGTAEFRSPNLLSIIDQVSPSVENLLKSELRNDPDALVQQAVHDNVHDSVTQLRDGSAILGQLIQTEGLLVVGAVYSLETGKVEFLDAT